jgi:hypothetical protein
MYLPVRALRLKNACTPYGVSGDGTGCGGSVEVTREIDDEQRSARRGGVRVEEGALRWVGAQRSRSMMPVHSRLIHALWSERGMGAEQRHWAERGRGRRVEMGRK